MLLRWRSLRRLCRGGLWATLESEQIAPPPLIPIGIIDQ
jgi:hypothetical protein